MRTSLRSTRRAASLTRKYGVTALIALAASAVLTIPSDAHADNGTWTNASGGTWDTLANWAGGIAADGSGSTADFSTLNLTANRTVTLGSSQTIGNLIFDDAGATGDNSWTLSNGGTASRILTLAGPTPTIYAGNSSTINAVIDGTSGLTKTGSGTLYLNAANTYSGGTFINAGTLSPSAGTLPSGDISIASAGTLNVSNNTFSNDINLNGGTINLSTGTLLGAVKVLSSSSIGGPNSGTGTLSGGLEIAAGATASFTWANDSVAIAGPITGSGSLYSTLLNVLTFGSNNSAYTGSVSIVRGSLALGADSALGTGPMSWNISSGAGTIRSTDGNARTVANNIAISGGGWNFGATSGGTGDLAFTGAVALNVSPTFTIYNTTTFNGVISGNGFGITKAGSGTLVLAGANTFNGTLTVNAGTVRAGADSSGATSGVFGRNAAISLANTAGVVLDLGDHKVQVGSLSGGGANGGNVTLGSGTLTVAGTNSASVTYAGIISGAGSVAVTGNGTQVLSGANTFGGGLAKSGSGTLTLTGSNTFSGGITSGSTLALAGGNLVIGDGTNGSVASQALTFSGTSGVNFKRAADAAQAMEALTFSAGEGTLTSTYAGSGNSSLTFSSLATRNAGATGNFVISSGSNGSTNKIVLTGVTADSFIDPGIYFGGAYAWNDAAGYVRSIAWGADAGSTTTAGGASLASTAYAQTTASVTAQQTEEFTALNLHNTTSTARSFTLAGEQTVTVNSILRSGNGSGTFTITGGTGIQAPTDAELIIRNDQSSDGLVIAATILANGTNRLVKGGAGTLNLSSNNNAYTGGTTINAGTLTASANGALGSGDVKVVGGVLSLSGVNLANNVTLAGGGLSFSTATTSTLTGDLTLASLTATINLSGNSTTQGRFSSGKTLTLNEGQTLSITGSGSLAFDRTISGKGNLSVDGTTALSADNSGYSGTTSFSNGTLLLGHDNALGTGLFAWSQRDVSAGIASTSSTARTITNRVTLSGKTNYNSTFGQSSGGTGNLIFTGGGTLGTLRAVVLNTTEFSGSLSGSAVLTLHTGSTGTLVFSGANTFGGTVAVNAGTLLANNTTGSATGTSAVTVGGGTLGGSGIISGAVTVNSGLLAPGNSPGKLTVGALNLGANATTLIEIGGQALATDYDQVNITGSVTYGGTLNIIAYNSYDLAQEGNYNLFDFASTTGSSFAFVNVGGLGLTNDAGTWTGSQGNATYTFTESDGVLSVVIPEPTTSAMLFMTALAGGFCSRRPRRAHA